MIRNMVGHGHKKHGPRSAVVMKDRPWLAMIDDGDKKTDHNWPWSTMVAKKTGRSWLWSA